MFGEIAPRYDFLNHFLSFGIDKYWRWQTVRSVAPLNDSPMLDLCTGTGDLALAYAKHLPTGGKIVGADFCHEMLAIGRQKAARAGHNGQMTFVEADAQHLPFSDNQFQIVCVAFGLRNITDTDRGLREMVRVCQPGGRVAVLEFSMPRRQPVRGIYTLFLSPRVAENRPGCVAEPIERLQLPAAKRAGISRRRSALRTDARGRFAGSVVSAINPGNGDAVRGHQVIYRHIAGPCRSEPSQSIHEPSSRPRHHRS